MPCDFDPSQVILPSRSSQRVKIAPLTRTTSKERSRSVASPALQLQHTPQSGVTPSLSPCPVSFSVWTPNERLLEFRLFHHFMKMSEKPAKPHITSCHSSNSQALWSTWCQGLWSTWISTLAINSPCVMDALLGFSAFHLRLLYPSDFVISQASHKYMAKAIAEHTKQLRDGVNEENAEVLFATSIFITFHASVYHHLLESDSGDRHATLLHWFRPYRGTKAVLTAGWQWMQNSKIRPVILRWNTSSYRSEEGPRPFAFLLTGLLSENLDAETREAYESAVAYLTWIYDTFGYNHALRSPANVTQRFMELLTAKDPRALTIAGYFFMLLKMEDHIWWLDRPFGGREFEDLMNELPKDWWPRMEWAIREFGGIDGEPE
jgi:hypothetical protein